MVDLNRYCDLTHNQLAALRDPEHAHPAMRDSLLRDRLLCRSNGRLCLTPDGRAALARAERFLAGEQPSEPLLVLLDGGGVRFRPDRERGLGARHLKALLDLALHPGLAWRWLSSTYTPQVIRQLWNGDYIFGRPVRGAPQVLTRKGLVALTEALDRVGVQYVVQADFLDL